MTRKLAYTWLPALLLSSGALSAKVSLKYGTFVGYDNYANDANTTLPNPVVAYLNIPYAAPPIGERRSKHPQAPLKIIGNFNSTTYGPACPQPGILNIDEDCLTLAVYAPKGTKPSDKLSVVVWFHGGAFNAGSKNQISLASMVSGAPVKYVAVGVNYRLGAYGWLPSNLTQKAGLLNLGLYDQAYAIDWVQKYIKSFGGDPEQVTLFGQSAGGTTVGYHMFNLEKKPKFKRVIMDSGAPTARAIPDWTYPVYQTQMSEFLNITGCSRGSDEVATFSCLREVPQRTITDASLSIFSNYYGGLGIYPFQIVVDHKYISQAAHVSWESGDFHKMPILTGFNTDEANALVPRNLNTTGDFLGFLKRLLPLLSDSHLAKIEQLYPAPEHPKSPYTNSPLSPQFLRIAAAYSDLSYIAQVQATSIYASKANISVWKYHFDHLTPGADSWIGVNHTSELPFVSKIWANKLTGQVADQSRLMNGYWSSFIVSGDPNTHVPKSAPFWPRYLINKQTELRLTNGTAYPQRDDFRREAMDFWRGIPEVLMH
ncbi:carbohydrate esterase family 10 protein [Rhizoctonia solani]|uniref:Carboxylic ester hydrolase n=1 Tax=Rhizoctonia solani TaxID=456999 RepID=A0A8H8NR34_9AGAM|nr:carbohydrate esterase family 10 protein [Rhizoctonia solani]QRW18436.1 carbohydrate esterase family 10 protein [Rhizoctonia solani]